MTQWKCTACGYTYDADTPYEQCPACKAKCEFVDVGCYIPDCAEGKADERIGSKKET